MSLFCSLKVHTFKKFAAALCAAKLFSTFLAALRAAQHGLHKFASYAYAIRHLQSPDRASWDFCLQFLENNNSLVARFTMESREAYNHITHNCVHLQLITTGLHILMKIPYSAKFRGSIRKFDFYRPRNISTKILTHNFYAVTAGASMDNIPGLSCRICKELFPK